MSKKKRRLEKMKKQSSPAAKLKQAKKRYYSSTEAAEKWDERKARKEQSQRTKRQSLGISQYCPLPGWQTPTKKEHCRECNVRSCSFRQEK